MDESALLKSAEKLDQGTLVPIFDTYAPMVYRYCFRLCLDPVESDQFVGVVFSRLLENLASRDSRVSSVRVYIFRIAYQVIVDELEAGRPVTITETERKKTLQLAFVREPIDDRGHIITKLVSALNMKLTAIQRHVLLLRFLENFSLNETALIVGKSVNNVKVIQDLALAKIGQSLGLQNNLGQQDIASKVEP